MHFLCLHHDNTELSVSNNLHFPACAIRSEKLVSNKLAIDSGRGERVENLFLQTE